MHLESYGHVFLPVSIQILYQFCISADYIQKSSNEIDHDLCNFLINTC